jgi:hypothetical protein
MSIVDALIELRREPTRTQIGSADGGLVEARRSLRYWEARRRELPWYRRTQRREAVEMADRWRDRLRAAELQRLGRGRLGQLAVLAGASAARTFVRRGAITLAVAGGLVLAATVAIVTLWPHVNSALWPVTRVTEAHARMRRRGAADRASASYR